MTGVLPRALRGEIEKQRVIESYSPTAEALTRIEQKLDALLQREEPPKRPVRLLRRRN